ncbi:MAG: kinase [Magnetococcales bacterium]|nr:kinase [Magnetococcales bacterium]
MIICRTPFRISFFGGGTDYPVWYRKHGGSVLSTSIDKYCFITCRRMPPFFDYRYRIRYFRDERVSRIDEIQHASVRECCRYLDVDEGIEIVHNADLPARSGLGSSSTFTVGLLHALHTLKQAIPTKRQLALQAIHVEQEMIGENVGSQDQTAAAFGGFNRIDFSGGKQPIVVSPIVMSSKRFEELQRHMMLFFTGFSRNASDIAGEQIKNTRQNKIDLTTMHTLVDEALKILLDSGTDLMEFGRLLHEQWRIKRTISTLITNSEIDAIYERGRQAGGIGGKLLGAGGGGFMLFFAKPEDHQRIKEAMSGLLHVPFKFEDLGSQIIYYSRHDQQF